MASNQMFLSSSYVRKNANNALNNFPVKENLVMSTPDRFSHCTNVKHSTPSSTPSSKRHDEIGRGVNPVKGSSDTPLSFSSSVTETPNSSVFSTTPLSLDTASQLVGMIPEGKNGDNVQSSDRGSREMSITSFQSKETNGNGTTTCLMSEAQSDRGCSLSPASFSDGNQSAGLSTSDSIFTYSLSDDNHTDGRSGKSCEDETDQITNALNNNKSTDLKDDKEVIASSDNKVFVESVAVKKKVIEKDYVHTITYAYSDLLLHLERNGLLNFESSDPSKSIDDKSLQSSKKTKKTPPSDQKENLSRNKFSSQSIKKFLKSMSPGSRHRNRSKDSGSLSSRSSNTLAESIDSMNISEADEVLMIGEESHAVETPSKKSPGLGHTHHGRNYKRMNMDNKAKGTGAELDDQTGDKATMDSSVIHDSHRTIQIKNKYKAVLSGSSTSSQ